MTGENKENNKNEKCPLCKVSEDTLEKLKNNGSKTESRESGTKVKMRTSSSSPSGEIKNKKSFWKLW